MKFSYQIGFVLLMLAGCAMGAKKTSAPVEPTVANYLTDIRQLTFEGSRAGEGYFSHDGRYMVFQSEREKENP
ncbi:MAG: hypothetical protein ACXVA9_12860, partial [Bdellovibrionales bacterium]